MLFQIETTRANALRAMHEEYDYGDLDDKQKSYVDPYFAEIMSHVEHGCKVIENDPLAVRLIITD